MLNKIYKYRPLSEFLFKELYYNEIYFASYSELNDPLDLSMKINFFSTDKDAIEYLIWFIFKTHINPKELSNTDENIKKLIKFHDDKEANEILVNELYESVINTLEIKNKIFTDDIIDIINKSIKKAQINIVFDPNLFRLELNRLTNKFFKNSYVTCFSETNNNFLMWSHYASKHSGICLEFNIEYGNFAYERKHNRGRDNEKYIKRISEWDTKSTMFWDRINKVYYEDEQPIINFYDFAVVFENEHEPDLIGLNKQWAHKYAYELESAFATKTKNWSYEKEWRAIEINFDEPKEPEERIRHYPNESLTAVYFGVNTPEHIKMRIYKMLVKKNEEIRFYNAELSNNDEIEFNQHYFD